jgi:hypothetical protein
MTRRREYVRVGDASVDCLRAELALLAAGFVLPGLGPDVNRAIMAACELLAEDLDTPATVAVAALAYGTPLRDAGPVMRDMLHEQGFPAAEPGAGEAEEFTTVLRAVAAGGMQAGEFFTFFMGVVPAWGQQDELQRRLVVLLDDWVRETTPEGRSARAAHLRRVARDAVADAS